MIHWSSVAKQNSGMSITVVSSSIRDCRYDGMDGMTLPLAISCTSFGVRARLSSAGIFTIVNIVRELDSRCSGDGWSD